MRHDPSPATSGGRALSRPMDKAGDHATTPVARVGAFARASLALLVLLLASGVLASLARAERPGAANAAPTFPARAESPPLVPAGLREQAEEQGSARVIVRLRMSFVPEGRLRRSEALDQRDRIADLRGRLKEAVSDSGTRVVRE